MSVGMEERLRRPCVEAVRMRRTAPIPSLPSMHDSNLGRRTDEHLRLQALERYHVLDTAPESQFDDLVQLAAALCKMPMAIISLLDDERQWFKASVGLDLKQTSRDIAFCEYVLREHRFVVVPDTYADPRFADNPLVRGEPGIRFYAGAPLETADGYVLGSLGVFDRVPRRLTALQKRALQVLAHQVVAQLELRRNLVRLHGLLAERDRARATLQRSHRELESTVRRRTADLRRANENLMSEIGRTAREASFSQALIDSLPGIVYVVDEKQRLLRWNRALESVCGVPAERMLHRKLERFLATAEDRDTLEAGMARAFDGADVAFEVDVAAKDGRTIPYYFTGARIVSGEQVLVCGMGVDVTERQRAEEALRLRDRAVQASVNAIIITDLSGNIEFANPAFERITGYSAAEAIGRNCRFLQGADRMQAGVVALREAIAGRHECKVLLRNYRKNGDLFWNDVHVAPVRGPDGGVTHFVGVLNDVTALKYYERELEWHAKVDALTALANRSVLQDRLFSAIARAQRQGTTLAVGFIDLDNFKFINESLGHKVGDELLKRIAERLLGCLDAEDTVARYGGDEFAVVLVGHENEQAVAARVERILQTVDRPIPVEEHTFHISCSIGLAFFPRDGGDVDTLLKNADAAMHRAKERGRNNFQIYTPAMHKRVSERLSLEGKLRRALARKEFTLHYQPKLDLRSGAVIGAEALLRWPSAGARGASVPPSVFIPLAEETGLINAIGEWVLNTACMQNKAMQDMGVPPLRVAVNISARQFEPHAIAAMVQKALTDADLEARYLELELTESMVMDSPDEAIEVLRHLKDMGLSLAIDDFGTGYSSLSYLQRFPVDLLKIDQSFVRDIGADPNDAVIARAVISLGHSLGLQVIAEGVSSPKQLAFLRANDCDEIQGYLFSRPLPFEELVHFLRRHTPTLQQ